jgi:hypothetical protein
LATNTKPPSRPLKEERTTSPSRPSLMNGMRALSGKFTSYMASSPTNRIAPLGSEQGQESGTGTANKPPNVPSLGQAPASPKKALQHLPSRKCAHNSMSNDIGPAALRKGRASVVFKIDEREFDKNSRLIPGRNTEGEEGGRDTHGSHVSQLCSAFGSCRLRSGTTFPPEPSSSTDKLRERAAGQIPPIVGPQQDPPGSARDMAIVDMLPDSPEQQQDKAAPESSPSGRVDLPHAPSTSLNSRHRPNLQPLPSGINCSPVPLDKKLAASPFGCKKVADLTLQSPEVAQAQAGTDGST